MAGCTDQGALVLVGRAGSQGGWLQGLGFLDVVSSASGQSGPRASAGDGAGSQGSWLKGLRCPIAAGIGWWAEPVPRRFLGLVPTHSWVRLGPGACANPLIGTARS